MSSSLIKKFLLVQIFCIHFCAYSQINIPGDTAISVNSNGQVSEGGAFLYSLQIEVSPGTAGVKPELSINYNSQSGNGLIGVGWNINGLSSITRSQQTYAQDNRHGFYEFDSAGYLMEKQPLEVGLPFTKSDRLMLDGMRLVLREGPYSGDASVFNANYFGLNKSYKTESEQFMKIESIDTTADGFPKSFKVWTKDGRIMEYGATEDSRIEASGTNIPLYWLVNRISDTKGNYIVFEYNENNIKGSYYLSKVRYTGNNNTGLIPYNEIQFIYESRQDIIHQNILGSRNIIDKRLQKIVVINDGTLFKEYKFIYTTSGINYSLSTGNSLVREIKTCYGNDYCPQAIVVKYNDMEPYSNESIANMYKVKRTSINPINPEELKSNDNKQILQGDWDGDGLDDLLVFTRNTGETKFYILQNKNFIFKAPLTNVISPYELINKIIKTSDFNGDGFTDLMYYDTLTGINRLLINDFKNTILNFYFNQDSASQYSSRMILKGGMIPAQYLQGKNKEVTINDFDNDGLPDIMIYNRDDFIENNNRTIWLVNTGVYNVSRHKTHNGKEIIGFKNYGNNLLLSQNDSSILIPIDITGDNFTDVYKLNPYTGENTLFRQVGNSSISSSTSHFNFPEKFSKVNPIDTFITRLPQNYLDVNGDGLIDFYFKSPTTANGLIYVNKGNGSFDTSRTIAEFANILNQYKNINFLDLNHDGKSDFLLIDSSKNAIYVSNPLLDSTKNYTYTIGQGIFTINNPFDTVDLKPNHIIFIDQFSSTSKIDFFIIDPITGRNTFYSLQKQFSAFYSEIPNPQEDLVYEIFDKKHTTRKVKIKYYPIGNTANPQYDQHYKFTATKNKYPYISVRQNFVVVNRIEVPDGGVISNSFDYHYENLRTNVLGRGIQGFEKITVFDFATYIKNIKYSKNDSLAFLFSAEPNYRVEDISVKYIGVENEDVLLNTRSSTYKTNLDNINIPTSFFTYKSIERQLSYELNGTLTDSVIHHQKIDITGNLIYQVTDYGDNLLDSTYNVYNDNLNLWHLGRITKAQLFRYAPGKPTITKTSSFEYDPFNGMLIKEISEPDNQKDRYEKRFSYDSYGNVLNTEIIARNNGMNESRFWQQSYDTKGRFVLINTNPLAHQNKFTYESKYGNVVAATDENNIVTTFEYDIYGRKIKEIYPDGNWIKYDYRKGSVSSIDATCSGNCDFFIYKQFSNKAPELEYFNNGGNSDKIRTINFNGKYIYTATFYFQKGLLQNQSLPSYEPNPNPESAPSIIFRYDKANRLKETEYPNGSIEEKIYNGRSVEQRNVLGQKKSWKINGREQTIEVTDNQGNKLFYEYDAAGNHTKTTDPKGNMWVYEYDLRGRMIKMLDPDIGTQTYAYNGFNELIYSTNDQGQETKYELDKLGRLTKRTTVEGITNYTYDNGTKAIGKLSSISHPGNNKSFSYDTYGRLVQQTHFIQGKPFVLNYTYDAGSRIEKVKYPTGLEIKYIYNTQGYISEVRRVSDNYLFWKALKMNARNEIEEEEFGNGFKTLRFYDSLTTTLDSTYTSKAGVYSQNFAFTHNAIGNLTSRTNKKYSKTEEFYYDELNRLIKSQITGQDTLEITYDELGNILTKSDVGKYYYGGANNGPHRVVRIEKLTNVCIPSEEISAEYTSFNKVKRMYKDTAAELKIEYGAEHQRVYQELYENNVLKRHKFYIENLFEQEIKGDTITNNHYIRVGTTVVAIFTSTNKGGRSINFWHKDHLGSLTSITDSAGNVVQELSFDSWGKRRNKDWTGNNSTDTIRYLTERGYTTHEHYDLFALVDMNGRIYDPVIGRFLSADPFIDDISVLQSYNRYSYVSNNPLSYTDPSGYFKIKLIAKIVKSVAKAYINAIVPDKVQKWVKENWKQIAVVAVAVGVGVLTAGAGTALLGPTLWAAMAAGAASGFITGVAATLIYGGNAKDALRAGIKGAIIGTVSAGLSYGVGSAGQAVQQATKSTAASTATRVAGHAISQGAVTKYQGGRFSDGFWSGAVSTAGETFTTKINSKPLQVASSAAVGGTTSTITGGKFANGAVSGAFVMMFNQQMHEGSGGTSTSIMGDDAIDGMADYGSKLTDAYTSGYEIGENINSKEYYKAGAGVAKFGVSVTVTAAGVAAVPAAAIIGGFGAFFDQWGETMQKLNSPSTQNALKCLTQNCHNQIPK